MTKVIYNRQHIGEYLLYGGVAGILFGCTVWYMLLTRKYEDNWIIHAGSMVFFFVILFYVMRLTRRRKDFKSTWTMLFAGMGAVMVGVVIATVFSAILSLIYLPGHRVINAPSGSNFNNSEVLAHIFFTAVLETFSAGVFAAVLAAYVIKPDQTKDRTADY